MKSQRSNDPSRFSPAGLPGMRGRLAARRYRSSAKRANKRAGDVAVQERELAEQFAEVEAADNAADAASAGSKGTYAQALSAPVVKGGRNKGRIAAVFAAMGPGLLSALAGNDAGGIATYSVDGAQYGTAILWIIPVMTVLLVIVQETSVRMSCVTGKGFSALIRESFGIRPTALAMGALLIANTTVMFSEFAGIAAGMEMFGISRYIAVPISAFVVWLLVMGGSYKRVEKILLVISCVFLSYIVAGVIAGPNWGLVIHDTFIPQVRTEVGFISLVISTIGTTIAPWMIFLAGTNVVDKGATAEDLPAQRIDAASGAIAACIVAWFIILTTATVLFPHGIVIEDATDAANALAPIAGHYAALLFAAGLVAASFLAACVLPLTTSYAMCEAFGWERGLDRSWSEAPIFRGIYTAIIIVSAVVAIIPGANLMAIMLLAQFINGVLLPVLLVFMIKIASNPYVMRGYANGRIYNALSWAAIVVVTVLTVILLVMQVLGMG